MGDFTILAFCKKHSSDQKQEIPPHSTAPNEVSAHLFGKITQNSAFRYLFKYTMDVALK